MQGAFCRFIAGSTHVLHLAKNKLKIKIKISTIEVL